MPKRKHFVVIGRLPDRDNSIWEGKAEDQVEAEAIFHRLLESDEDQTIERSEIIFEAVLSAETPITCRQASIF